MLANPPVLRNHDILRLTSSCDQRMQCFAADTWEIGVPEKQSLFWSILLAFLKPNERLDLTEFNVLVQYLTGETFTYGDYLTSINNYNPFLGRYSCFQDTILISLMSTFEQRVKSYVNVHEQKFRLTSEFDELEVASLMLSCKITVIYEMYSMRGSTTELIDPIIMCYPQNFTPEGSTRNQEIILYCKIQGKEIPNKVFAFSLTKQVGYALQKISFETIIQPLKLGISQKCYQELYKVDGIVKNFLISLLKTNKSNFLKVIHGLYQQPPYILWKLEESGFVTDPRRKDLTTENQPNAFYYALLFGKSETVYLLYKYATSICRFPRAFCRTPHPKILENLREICLSLTDARTAFKNTPSELLSEAANDNLAYLEELTQINDIQLIMRQGIFDVNQNVGFAGDLSETKKRKDTLTTILSAYADRFHSANFIVNEERLTIPHFEHYMECINYFQNLDFIAALFFFDNVTLLKQKLQLENGQYDNIESAFIKFVFINKQWFGKVKPKIDRQLSDSRIRHYNSPHGVINFKIYSHEDVVMSLSYLSRIFFEKELISFKNHLSDFLVPEKNINDASYTPSVYNLTSEPLIKDELMLFRLNHYLHLAANVDFKNGHSTAIFVIQRALQVLGESVHLDKEDGAPTVAKSFLISAFTEDVAKTLAEIRHCLSHHDLKRIRGQLDIEKDETFFRRIQVELKPLEKSLNYIFQLQVYRTQNYVRKNEKDMMNYWRKVLLQSNYMQKLAALNTTIANEQIYKFVEQCARVLKQQNILNEEFARSERQLRHMLNFKRIYKNHLQNHFVWIKDHSTNKDITIDTMKCRFICIQVLLKLLVNNLTRDERFKSKFISDIDNAREKIQTALPNDKDKARDFSDIIQNILNEHEILKDELYSDAKISKLSIHENMKNPLANFEESAIKHYFRILDGHRFISELEKNEICCEVPEDLIAIHNFLKKLQGRLQKSTYDFDALISEAQNLQLSKNKLSEIEEVIESQSLNQLQKFTDSNNHFGTLLKCLDESKMKIKVRDHLSELCPFSENVKSILDDITEGRRTKDRALDFFCDRVKILKKLLVEHDSDINRLWENAKSKRLKDFNHEQILCHYMQDKELQAAIEFLLFNCLVFLQERHTHLKDLWYKTTSLFNGEHFRNMLAHGNPLFEAAVKFYDPTDLPNDIVSKVLELVEDVDAILAMRDLRMKTGFNRKEFKEFVRSGNEEHHQLIENIKSCKKWQEYAYLIPE